MAIFRFSLACTAGESIVNQTCVYDIDGIPSAMTEEGYFVQPIQESEPILYEPAKYVPKTSPDEAVREETNPSGDELSCIQRSLSYPGWEVTELYFVPIKEDGYLQGAMSLNMTMVNHISGTVYHCIDKESGPYDWQIELGCSQKAGADTKTGRFKLGYEGLLTGVLNLNPTAELSLSQTWSCGKNGLDGYVFLWILTSPIVFTVDE